MAERLCASKSNRIFQYHPVNFNRGFSRACPNCKKSLDVPAVQVLHFSRGCGPPGPIGTCWRRRVLVLDGKLPPERSRTLHLPLPDVGRHTLCVTDQAGTGDRVLFTVEASF